MNNSNQNSQNKDGFKVPPQSLDSEMALIGSILLKPDSVNEIIESIRPESFYSDRHKKIFETIMELYAKSIPIDLISLSARLKEKKVLDQVGGKSYLSDIVESVPSAANIKHYADMFNKKSIYLLEINQ